jgi:hypothetical protein
VDGTARSDASAGSVPADEVCSVEFTEDRHAKALSANSIATTRREPRSLSGATTTPADIRTTTNVLSIVGTLAEPGECNNNVQLPDEGSLDFWVFHHDVAPAEQEAGARSSPRGECAMLSAPAPRSNMFSERRWVRRMQCRRIAEAQRAVAPRTSGCSAWLVYAGELAQIRDQCALFKLGSSGPPENDAPGVMAPNSGSTGHF